MKFARRYVSQIMITGYTDAILHTTASFGARCAVFLVHIKQKEEADVIRDGYPHGEGAFSSKRYMMSRCEAICTQIDFVHPAVQDFICHSHLSYHKEDTVDSLAYQALPFCCGKTAGEQILKGIDWA